MRVKICATYDDGEKTLKNYPILKKYEPKIEKCYYGNKLTIEITPEEIINLAIELGEKIIIKPQTNDSIELEIYDCWRE